MLCKQHHTHTQYAAKNRLLVFSQEKLNTSLNSSAYEASLLATQALTRGLCYVTPTAQCFWRPAQYATSKFTDLHHELFFSPLSGSMFTTCPYFFTQKDSREFELASMMWKQKPVATEQNHFTVPLSHWQKSKRQRVSYSLPEGPGAWTCPLHQLLCLLHRCCNHSVPQLPLTLPAQALHLKRKQCHNS